MCGKFTQLYSWQDVHAFSRFLDGVTVAGDTPVVATPMRFASILRPNAAGAREMVQMRWGFAGRDDANPTKPKHMHARAETIDRLPTFAHGFAQARGILMVETFNEGEELPNGKTRQWVITPQDRQPIALAVICEQWRNGAETLDTFVQVTVPANALIARITDRMPAILPRAAWAAWLGETEDAAPADIKALLATYEDGGNWAMAPQTPGPKPSRRKNDAQHDLF
jgi:putative SOS response-associated peptidase YedK